MRHDQRERERKKEVKGETLRWERKGLVGEAPRWSLVGQKGINVDAFRVHYMTSIDFPLTLMDIRHPIYSSKTIKPLATGQYAHLKHTHKPKHTETQTHIHTPALKTKSIE